ncbi:Uncharacterized protein {ECO:0000313/EMBL:CCF10370.1} [Pantoea ananatis]|nr:hypothetical protein PANA5342_2977 [Pantoea ananatis LMG 5342]CRH28775.1 Uncharacterized protein {ECO:0000313/EMBL:CCF10370.1} [Pantoea ananatis]CRH33195.1 Uncharacterized protein BN1183_AR_00240 [Pantoea ananatis]CRH37710.1 Uncharacterized protein {ECO:0000313/EMBL:CCF10370.1} [Pantoea ananatis]
MNKVRVTQFCDGLNFLIKKSEFSAFLCATFVRENGTRAARLPGLIY